MCGTAPGAKRATLKLFWTQDTTQPQSPIWCSSRRNSGALRKLYGNMGDDEREKKRKHLKDGKKGGGSKKETNHGPLVSIGTTKRPDSRPISGMPVQASYPSRQQWQCKVSAKHSTHCPSREDGFGGLVRRVDNGASGGARQLRLLLLFGVSGLLLAETGKQTVQGALALSGVACRGRRVSCMPSRKPRTW